MCTDADLAAALEAIGPLPVTLLHCVGGRPDVSETALGLLAEYRRLGTVREVGYLGFEPGIAVAAAARALGATVIEKLLTLDRDFDGPWHRQSIDPATMKQLVDIMGGLDFSLNAHGPRRLLAIELEALAESGLSLVTAAPLKAHSVVRAEDIMVRGALRGLTPRLVQTVIGKRVLYDLPADAPITFGVLEP
jgi:sialic acid synthase SpsE